MKTQIYAYCTTTSRVPRSETGLVVIKSAQLPMWCRVRAHEKSTPLTEGQLLRCVQSFVALCAYMTTHIQRYMVPVLAGNLTFPEAFGIVDAGNAVLPAEVLEIGM